MSAKATCPEDDCDEAFKGDSRVDVLRKVFDHIRRDHAQKINAEKEARLRAAEAE